MSPSPSLRSRTGSSALPAVTGKGDFIERGCAPLRQATPFKNPLLIPPLKRGKMYQLRQLYVQIIPFMDSRFRGNDGGSMLFQISFLFPHKGRW